MLCCVAFLGGARSCTHKEEQGQGLGVLWLQATGWCAAKTARNGRGQKGGGELTKLWFTNHKAVCPPKPSSSAKIERIPQSAVLLPLVASLHHVLRLLIG